jgi:hypothetical protein
MAVVLPSGGSLLGVTFFFLSYLPVWSDDVIMMSPALLTDAVLMSLELLATLVGGSFNWTRGSITHVLNGFS